MVINDNVFTKEMLHEAPKSISEVQRCRIFIAIRRAIFDGSSQSPHRFIYLLHRLLTVPWTQKAIEVINDAKAQSNLAATVGLAIQSRYDSLRRAGTLPKAEQRVKSTLLACSIKEQDLNDNTKIRALGKFFGYTGHHADFRHLMSYVQDSYTSSNNNALLTAIENGCRRTRRVDAISGNPIWTIIWHAATTEHKGTKKRRKMLREKQMVVVNGKLKAVSVFLCHQRRIQVSLFIIECIHNIQTNASGAHTCANRLH